MTTSADVAFNKNVKARTKFSRQSISQYFETF